MNVQKYHVSKNMWDAEFVGSFSCTTNISENSVTQRNSGTYARSIWRVSNLTIGEDYTVSLNYDNQNGCSIRISIVNSTDTQVTDSSQTVSSLNGVLSVSFTAQESSICVRFYSNTLSAVNTYSVTFSDFMLNKGDYIPYEPYDTEVWHDLAPQQYINGVFVNNADIPEKYRGGSWS